MNNEISTISATPEKKRLALYMLLESYDYLKEIADEKGVSVNKVAVHMVELGINNYEGNTK